MSLRPQPDAVVFDFDGPIIDSRQPIRMALGGALREHGYAARSEAELDAVIGPPTRQALAELTGEPEDSLAALEQSYHERYGAVYLAHTALVDGIFDVLSRLRLPLALATSKQREFVEPLLEEFGLSSRFRVVCAPTLSGPPEPKTKLVARALKELGAHRAAVIGDRHFDIEAARLNGAQAVGVTWGIGSRSELEQAGADIIVQTPAELLWLLGSS
jgi:phosphoglycolate phosphatase